MMKKSICLILALLLILCTAAFAEKEEATAEQTPAPAPTVEAETTPEPTPEPLRLTGIKIGIDPGHQGRGNSEKEAIAPGSSEMKAKVSSGTEGVRTHVAEHVVNLQIGLMLRDALEALGAEVYMTRESADVDISNQERAIMMNEFGVDAVLRLHCDGAEGSKTNGIGLYIRATGEKAAECEQLAKALMPAMLAATGAREFGTFKFDTYTGLNWSTVPCVMVEMGFMSNPDEDVRLNDPAYQAKLVEGMVNGICAYVGR